MMNGWIWLLAAFVLAALELALPGWAFLGIAIAVFVIALGILSGLWTAGLPLTLVAVVALSAAIWFVLRHAMGVQKGQVKVWNKDINDD